MVDETAQDGPGARRPGDARRRPWRAVPTRNPVPRRQGGPLIVRWIGAARRRKAAVPEIQPARTPPAPAAEVIVLADVRAWHLLRTPPRPAKRPASVRGNRMIAATLLPFVRPACPA